MSKEKLQKKPKFRSKISRSIYHLVTDLHASGIFSEEEMIQFTISCIKPPACRRNKGKVG